MNKIVSRRKLSPLKFQPSVGKPFWEDLNAAVGDYMTNSGNDRFADVWLHFKNVFLCLSAGTAYLGALHTSSRVAFVLLYVAAFFLAMVLAMNSLHDAAHNVISRRPWVNRAVRRCTAMVMGVDPEYWTIRHVHYHHTYPNIEGYDLDIEPNPFLRQAWFHKLGAQYAYQHLYWPLIAALSLPYLCWYWDWLDRFGMSKVQSSKRMKGVKPWAMFLTTKAMHVLLTIVLPSLLLRQIGHVDVGWGFVVLCYLGAQMLASSILVALILGTHWAEVDFFQPPPEGRMGHTWYEHSFLTCCDWKPRPSWIAYWLGGLNYHLTHHLLPNVSHRHYPVLARIVERLGKKHGLNYRMLSYTELVSSQQVFLKEIGAGTITGAQSASQEVRG